MSIRVGFVMALVACGGGGSRSAVDAAIPEDPRPVVATVPVTVNRNLDVLFVIDDSTGMEDKQANLANNFPNFVNSLNTIEGGLPDVHIGVTSTDLGTQSSAGTPAPGIGTVGQGGCANTGDDGKLQTSGAAVTGAFISDIKQTDGSRLKNYTGDLSTVFAQMARLGATGCGFEQSLAAMKRALQNTIANPGFLRPDAKLAVVFVTDEDDCSAKDPALFGPDSTTTGPLTSFRCTRFGVTCQVGGATADAMNTVGDKVNCGPSTTSTLVEDSVGFASFLRSLKLDPRNIFVAGIIGNPTPLAVEQRQINGTNQLAVAHSCSYLSATGEQVADPAIRLKRFLEQFPNRTLSSTVCQPDQATALADIGRGVGLMIGSPCITARLAMPLDCIVEDETSTSKTTVAQCGSPETAPCWKLATDVQQCPFGDHLRVQIVRSEAPHPSTIATMRCKVDPF